MKRIKPVLLIHGYAEKKLVSFPDEISGLTVSAWTCGDRNVHQENLIGRRTP